MANKVGRHGEQIDSTSFYYGKCELLKENGKIKPFATDQTFYSFDSDTGNVHIVPRDEVVDTDKYVNTIGQLRKKLEGPGGPGSIGCVRINKKSAPTWYTQKCIVKKGEDGFEYLLAFETLYLADSKVNCRLGQLQYFRYKDYGVNCKCSDNAKLLYPGSSSGNVMMYDKASGHCIFNSTHTIYDSPKDIDAEFKDFRDGRINGLSWNEHKQASTR